MNKLKNLDDYFGISKHLVKKDRINEWKKYLKTKIQDDASLKVMTALSEGQTPREAEESVYNMKLSGFAARCMAEVVSYFHERGDEFRNYWNQQFHI